MLIHLSWGAAFVVLSRILSIGYLSGFLTHWPLSRLNGFPQSLKIPKMKASASLDALTNSLSCSLQMKVVGLLLVVFLVSTEARFPKRLGTLFGKVTAKLPLRKPGAQSATPYAEPSAKKSPPAFCDTYDCPEFYEVKQDASSYTLRCYPKPYRWVSTSVTGKVLTWSWSVLMYYKNEGINK